VAAGPRLSALFLALLLAACWEGKPFYSKDELRAPIRPGLYRTVGTNSPSDHGGYRISVRPDGYTLIARLDGAEMELVGFVPLPRRDGLFVAWFEEQTDKLGKDEGTAYGLLERRGDEYVASFPMCSETRVIAEAAGAVFHADPKVPICGFPDRASLEAGLRRVAAEGPMETLRLVPAAARGRE
jgi:hypothetical protein